MSSDCAVQLQEENTFVLFPGPGAVDIETIDSSVLHDGRQRNLIVVDGTWRQAGRVMKDLKCLREAVEQRRVTCVQVCVRACVSPCIRAYAHCVRLSVHV